MRSGLISPLLGNWSIPDGAWKRFCSAMEKRPAHGYNTAMRVRVLFFGRLKDIVGQTEDAAELGDGARVEDLFARYGERYPELVAFRGSVVASINQTFADWRSPLSAGDEVAFLPSQRRQPTQRRSADPRPDRAGAPADSRLGDCGAAQSARRWRRAGLRRDRPRPFRQAPGHSISTTKRMNRWR